MSPDFRVASEVVSGIRLISPAVAFITGVMAFASVHHFLIGLRRPSERAHLAFAAMCFVAAVWASTGVVRYLTTDPRSFAEVMVLRQVLGNGIGIGMIWFFALYTGVRPKAYLYTVTAIHLGLVAAELILPYGTTFTGPPVLAFSPLSWGEVVTESTGPTGTWRIVSTMAPPLDLGFGIYASLALVRQGRIREAAPVALAILVLAAGLFGLSRHFLGPIPSAEIAFLGLILVMSLSVSDRVAEASAMKDALASSEQRLRTLVETAPEAVLLVDGESGAILEGNDGALSLFHMSREQLLNASAGLLAAPEQPEGEVSSLLFERRVHEALLGGRPVFRWVVRTRHGQDVPCEARLVKLPGSEPVMLRLSLVDLQSMEEAEARQSELEAQLRHSQRLEAVGRLTGGVAHDFNNLLTVVQGNLELLEEEARERKKTADDDHLELITQALEAAERGSQLTRRLLAFSRQQALEPKPVRLDALVSDLLRLLTRTLGADVTIEPSVPEGVWSFQADRVQLDSALLNLAINARDAMPDGGTLTISGENLVLGEVEPSSLGDLQPGRYVRIRVRDSGHGMTPDVARRAVDPFFTTKEVGKGSGLGLSMVYGFVTQSGGGLRLDSAPGQGTSVDLLFPAAEDEAPGGL